MKRNFCFSFLLIFVFCSCSNFTEGDKQKTTDECIRPPLTNRDIDFSYRENAGLTSNPVAPLPPWTSVFNLPKTPQGMTGGYQLYFGQQFEDHNQLWISSSWSDGEPKSIGVWENTYSLYNSNTSDLENIFVLKSDSEIYGYRRLILLQNGDIYGLRDPDITAYEYPLLHKFNKNSNTFEEIADNSNFFVTNNISGLAPYATDHLDHLWMIKGDYIYELEFSSLKSQRFQLGKNNTSILENITYSAQEDLLYLRFSGTTDIIKFSPKEKRIVEIISLTLNIPPSLYGGPNISNIFMDSANRLWVSDYGWLDSKGNEHQIISRFSGFYGTFTTDAPIKEGWGTPRLLFESSDGRLWFRSMYGLVWLDVEDGEWCWFTTYYSNIVEDSDRNLWMIADDKLYKLPLNP